MNFAKERKVSFIEDSLHKSNKIIKKIVDLSSGSSEEAEAGSISHSKGCKMSLTKIAVSGFFIRHTMELEANLESL